MPHANRLPATLLAAATLLLAAGGVDAHGPMARKPEATAAQARLFTSDSATGQVVAVDLPDGKVVARLATPPYILTMGLSADGRHLFAMRGRDTDRDTVTVIDTGTTGTGKMRFPSVVRTYEGRDPGGVHDGYLSTVGGKDAIFNEGRGELQVFNAGDFGSLGAVDTRTIKLAAPDHYHYQEAGPNLYVGHLRQGFVQILDRDSGSEVGRIENCPILHGMCDDEQTGRLFFACKTEVVVIGTRGAEANREVARVPFPEGLRAGVFMHGRNNVIWGTNEGANPAALRLDPRRQPYAFEAIPVNSAIQRGMSEDGSLMYLYLREGTLDIRDGETGKPLRRVRLSSAFNSEYHEHTDKALLPDITPAGKLVYVSLPTEGVIAEVDPVAGTVLRKIAVGGQPTRLVVVTEKAAATASAR